MNYDFEIKLSSKLSLKSTWDKVAVSRQRFFYTFILIISYQKWVNIKKYKKLIDICIGYLLCQKRYFEVTNTYMKSTKRNFPGILKFVLMSALLNAYLKFQGSIAVFYFYQNEKYNFSFGLIMLSFPCKRLGGF